MSDVTRLTDRAKLGFLFRAPLNPLPGKSMKKSILLIALVVLPTCAQDPYNEKPSYGRSRDFSLRHIKLELSFDLPMRRLMGVATLRMAPLGDGLREVCLDSAKLAINTVTIEGRQLEFHTADDKLYVALDREYPADVP